MRLLLILLLGLSAHAQSDGCAGLLLAELRDLREVLKPLARTDTAYDPAYYLAVRATGGYPLTEHCGCVATVVHSIYGGHVYLGRYEAVDGRQIWHVVNQIERAGCVFNVDLTKAQFGLAEDADELRPPPLRDVTEITAEALASNPRLQRFLCRYRQAQLQSSSSPR